MKTFTIPGVVRLSDVLDTLGFAPPLTESRDDVVERLGAHITWGDTAHSLSSCDAFLVALEQTGAVTKVNRDWLRYCFKETGAKFVDMEN